MVTFNYTEEFLRQAKRLAKRYRSLPDDINSLQHELIENPEIGVSLGGGKRKIRGRVIPPLHIITKKATPFGVAFFIAKISITTFFCS